jgi:hypothetical protein
MNIVNFIRFKLDRHYLLKHKNEHPLVKSKIENKLYFIANFNKKIIQIFDMEYLYTLNNVNEFYNNFRVVKG